VHARIVFKFLACPVQDKNIFNVSACFFETLILSPNLFQPSFALIARFSPVYIPGRLSEQFSGSWAAFETSFGVTGGF
jgi:hypothetical protein